MVRTDIQSDTSTYIEAKLSYQYVVHFALYKVLDEEVILLESCINLTARN